MPYYIYMQDKVEIKETIGLVVCNGGKTEALLTIEAYIFE